MKCIILTMCIVLVSPVYAKQQGNTTSMDYEGGGLPLNQHNKLKVAVTTDAVTFTQGEQT